MLESIEYKGYNINVEYDEDVSFDPSNFDALNDEELEVLSTQQLNGDVYGYAVKNNEGDEVDSCWGFYGYDHEKSGLMEYAKNAVDCDILCNRRIKLEKLKELIKNSVAIEKRGVILASL